MKRTIGSGITALALAAALNVLPSWAGGTLILNGKTASTDVRTVGGSAYVKLSDVARALGMVVVKRPDGKYEISKPGGANQVQGVTQGKVGDVLFDGRWRFQVLSVATPDPYTMKVPDIEPSSYPADTIDYNRTTHVVSAKPGYKLVALACRISNGQKTTETFWLARVSGRSINNALADSDGVSHVPVGYDVEGGPNQTVPLLPGAKLNMTLLFSVPEASQMQDLVFTLTNNDSSGTNDVRVSLKTP